MEDKQDLSKQIDFNKFIYHYKSKTVPKKFLSFKDTPKFYKNIKEGIIMLEKAEEEQKEFKREISDILKGKNKTVGQVYAINNIKTLYESREKVIKLFDDYSRIVFEAKYKRKYREVLKTLTPKQMLQRLPIALALVKAGNTSEIY